jgi:hypothetical protein
VSTWQPFAPDAVRILKRALTIAANDSAPRLGSEHLYRAVAEELGVARVRSLRIPDTGIALSAIAVAASARNGRASEIRSSRLSRDVRRIVDRAIKIAATRVEPRRHITGDDLVRAMSSFSRRRGRR